MSDKTTNKNEVDELESLVGFFSLLLEIDRRNNPKVDFVSQGQSSIMGCKAL